MRFLFRVFLLGPLFCHLVLLITSHWYLSRSLEFVSLYANWALALFRFNKWDFSSSDQAIFVGWETLVQHILFVLAQVYYFVFCLFFHLIWRKRKARMMIQLDVWKESSFLNSEFWGISIHISDLPKDHHISDFLKLSNHGALAFWISEPAIPLACIFFYCDIACLCFYTIVLLTVFRFLFIYFLKKRILYFYFYFIKK